LPWPIRGWPKPTRRSAMTPGGAVLRKALELSQQLPLAERYLIEANHAYLMKDNKKAIAAFENLAKTLPDSTDVEYTLGSLYLANGDFEKARAQFTPS